MIAIDLDDTIADFMGGFVKKYGPPLCGGRLDTSLRMMYPHLDIDAIVREPAFYLKLVPIEGAQRVLYKLSSMNSLIYLSARDPSLQDITVKWLRGWGFPAAPLICAGTEGKLMMLRRTNFIQILIDDMELFLRAASSGVHVIAYTQPWNMKLNIRRIRSWRDYDKRGLYMPKV